MRLLQVFCLSTRAGDMTGFDGNVPKTEHRTSRILSSEPFLMPLLAYCHVAIYHSF